MSAAESGSSWSSVTVSITVCRPTGTAAASTSSVVSEELERHRPSTPKPRAPASYTQTGIPGSVHSYAVSAPSVSNDDEPTTPTESEVPGTDLKM